MKRFIVTESQLKQYVETKKAEKVFYQIVEQIHRNQKLLKEGVSKQGANQSVIDSFKRKKLITPMVQEMLIKFKITNEKHEII